MEQKIRIKRAVLAIIITLAIVLPLWFFLPKYLPTASVIILGILPGTPPLCSIQTLLMILFAVGLSEITVRWRKYSVEMEFMEKSPLPIDDRTVLQTHDLGEIRRNILKDLSASKALNSGDGYLPHMVNRCILQFQASQSVEQTNSILNSLVELYSNQIQIKYSMLRYISWALPTVGFIGTIVGITAALGLADTGNIAGITDKLGIAFNTTLVALVQSAILVFLIHFIEEREESVLNRCFEICLNDLINRLYVGK